MVVPSSIPTGHMWTAVCVLLIGAMVPAVSPAQAQDSTEYQGMAVSAVEAERKCFKDLLQVYGVFVPKNEILVRPDREGLQIGQVLIEPGDTVSAGQVLARLVDPASPQQGVAIKAPVAGIAIGMSASVGSYASPSAPDPLFRIVADGELEMKGQMLATRMKRVKVGQTANLQIMGIGQIDGRVSSIDTTIDPMTQLGTIRLSVDPDPRLRSGVFARAEIDAGEDCGISVPLSAVLYGPEGAVVQVITGNHVETRRVEVGLIASGDAQIKDGLDESDLVVARAGGFLREGDRVRPFVTSDAAP